MTYFENSQGIRFYYKDLGEGPAILLVHSWAIDSSMWEYQVPALIAAGHRVVAMDRRGHGRSDEPGAGYDLDTLADDLAALVEHLDLSEITLVAHSMGCAEITRYLSRHGSARVSRAVYLAGVTPYVRGVVGEENYEAFLAEIAAERPLWFSTRREGYFAMPDSGVSDALADDQMATMLRTPLEVLMACQRAGTGTDVTAELSRVDVPVLVIHGDRDESTPLEITGQPTSELIPDSRLEIYAGGPHGLYVTHQRQLTADLLKFAAQTP
ncbi:alpha/beta fold hydrolase [Pseudonocardia spinosispora]|uniref:alpha/beta fold hydrolase n=1 Tax=Pseudonocardia spinosispora TaxID=103441 RepID=UPI0003FE5EB2|nr:alpha/beta hydrolase [Pseudonocardia spinosispora]